VTRIKSHMPQEKIDEKGHVPAQRAGSDEEMAQGIIFLAKSKYVSGEVIAIDGGVFWRFPVVEGRVRRLGNLYNSKIAKGLIG